MAIVYRDYGAISPFNTPNNEFITTTPHRQVYLVTHEGEDSLPFMKRSFISFTYGGKKIEDFNLIATTVNNSLSRTGFATFEDIVSSYSNLDGQQYWNTHYKSNALQFTLVTDGMDQRMLDDFLHWFHAGEAKELILAEHPNRGILARVSQPPQLELLPFEEAAQVHISDKFYSTSTTLYKGNIILDMVMDEPHWYSITNILGEKDEINKRYTDYWIDANGKRVDIFSSKDALKIIYEDGIPLGSMIDHNMLLGNGAYANVEENDISKVWSPAEVEYDEHNEPIGEGARIEADDAASPYQFGTIMGAVIEASGKGITVLPRASDNNVLAGRNIGYFYYSGTAPAPTIISFTLTPGLSSPNKYIKAPSSTRVLNAFKGTPYDTLVIQSRNTQELRFTTPNLYTSYNQVIYIFNTYLGSGTTKTWEDIRELLRDQVRHVRVREWANKTINELSDGDNIKNNSIKNQIIDEMSNFLKDKDGNEGVIQPAIFTFNSETGEAKGEFQYRLVTDPLKLTTIEEDVGDMLRSNYIIIRDRNYVSTDTGLITNWTQSHPEYSHRIYHNANVDLTNVQILYKNMYL